MVDGQQDIRNIGMANGLPAVLVTVTQQPGANVIRGGRSASRRMLPELQHELPDPVESGNDPGHHHLDPQFGARC